MAGKIGSCEPILPVKPEDPVSHGSRIHGQKIPRVKHLRKPKETILEEIAMEIMKILGIWRKL